MDTLVYSLEVILLAAAIALLIFLTRNSSSNHASWFKDKHSERVITFLREALDEYRFGKITSVKLIYGPHLQRIFCSHLGIEMLSQILDQMQPWQQDEVAGLMKTIGYDEYLIEQLSHDNQRVIGEVIRLLNIFKVEKVNDAVYALLLEYQTAHDIQYEGLSLLVKTGDTKHLLELGHNAHYTSNLSFNELSQLFSEYRGDTEFLYRDLLGSENSFLRRLIIRSIGQEKCYNFIPLLIEMCDSDTLSAEERVDILSTLDLLSDARQAREVKFFPDNLDARANTVV